MPFLPRILRLLPLLALLAGLGACSTFEGFLDRGARHPTKTLRQADTVPVAAPVADPISRNFFILETPQQSVVGALQVVMIEEGNTFSDLAREYGLGFDELLEANPGVDPWIPPAGTPVLLPTQYVLPAVPREGVVLNIATKRLFYFPQAEEGERQQVLTYPIGIGREGWQTPVGRSKVIAKARDPHWYVPASVRKEHAEAGDPLPAVVPPGPDNPLGRYVLKLDLPGYLIHGTNQPYGVGMRVSHGCVRLYPENIEVLYSLVDKGVAVAIVNQPYLLGQSSAGVYFESHRPLADTDIDTDQHLASLLESAVASDILTADADFVAAQMRAVATDARGVPVLVEAGDLDEIYARAVRVRNTVEPDPDAPTLAEVREMMDSLPPPELEDAPAGDAAVPAEGGTL